MVQRACIEQKTATLAEPGFGWDFLRKRWPLAIVDAIQERLPRYQRGPRKGQIKGWLTWDKVTEGGWSRNGYGGGGVVYPGSHGLRIGLAPYASDSDGFDMLSYAGKGDNETDDAYHARMLACFDAWLVEAERRSKANNRYSYR